MNTETTTKPEPLLIDVKTCCLWLSISRAKYFEAKAAGRIGPAEIKFGRKILLRSDEIRAWIEAGAPARRVWRWRSVKNG